MVHTHASHDDALPDSAIAEHVRRSMWLAVVLVGVLVLVGLAILWPSGDEGGADPAGLELDPVEATVRSVETVPCSFDPLLACRMIEVEPTEGDLEGERLEFEQPVTTTIDDGDGILVVIETLPDGRLIVTFYDFQRDTPMVLLVLLFVVAIIALGRWRGLGALAGLAMSLVVIIMFALPALLEGSNAVAVALVAAGAIAFIALFLAHGVNLGTATALVSTLASLAITALLAWIFVWASELTGLADESIGFLDALGTSIDPRGLLLAGIMIGALGVLDDVTVTQVSAVWELKRATPSAGVSELYHRGLRIGRDHVSSTVNTLFLAYAGAALPLLLLFREAGQSIGSVVTREIVAVEVVRALIGSIGLAASVPIATGLAAAVVTAQQRDPTSEVPSPGTTPAEPSAVRSRPQR